MENGNLELLPITQEEAQKLIEANLLKVVEEARQEVVTYIHSDLRSAYQEELKKLRGQLVPQAYLRGKHKDRGMQLEVNWESPDNQRMVDKNTLENERCRRLYSLKRISPAYCSIERIN